MIQRVYEQVAGILDDAYVATDDERIEAAVKAFGGKVVMTSTEHKSGTDRCQEACTKIGVVGPYLFEAVEENHMYKVPHMHTHEQIRARHRRIESDLEREEALHEKYAPLQKY